MKVAVLAPEHVPHIRGGLDALAERLTRELGAAGHPAQLVARPSKEHSLADLVASYRAWAELDLAEYDAVISLKYPTWMVQHPRHVVWMAHKLRGLFDMYPARLPLHLESPAAPVATALHALTRAVALKAANRDAAALAAEVVEVAKRAQPEAVEFPGPLAREVVLRLDELAMGQDRISRYAAISKAVTRRPGYFPRGAKVEVIYPPLAKDIHSEGSGAESRDAAAKPYLLSVSRLDRTKRIDLIIRAFKRVKTEAKLIIVGTGPEEAHLRAEAAGDQRVEFRGFVSDDELRALYAGCRAVVFTPLDEDFGYVCLEAFAAGRPVITTMDAGGPAELVARVGSSVRIAPTESHVGDAMQLALDVVISPGGFKRTMTRMASWDLVCSQLVACAN